MSTAATAAARAQSEPFSPAARLVSWGRQALESFVAAQKIILDLTAQQNALMIGVVRERLERPRFRPVKAIAAIAGQGVAGFTAVGRILLDLAAGESALVAEGVKEGLRLPPAAGAMTDLVHARLETLIEMQRQLLESVASETHAAIESYNAGEGLKPGAHLAELARRSIEGFVETEKKFLDMAAAQVKVATGAPKEGRKPARSRAKVLKHLAKEGVDKFVDVQKQLIEMAIDQWPEGAEAAAPAEAPAEARATLADLTQKTVQNFVTAQKSLMDLAIKPIKAPAAGVPRKAEARRKAKAAASKRTKR